MKSSRVEESAEVLRLERNPVVPRSHVSCLRVRKPVLPVTGDGGPLPPLVIHE